MKKISCSLLMVCGTVFLSSCTLYKTYNEHDNIRSKIEKIHKQTLAKRDFEKALPYVKLFDSVYVEPLSREDIKKPDWYREPRAISAVSNISLLDLLQQMFVGVRVNFQFLLGVNAQTMVSLPDLNLTYGEMLDYLSSLTGYPYSIDGMTVVFDKFETELFAIRQLPGVESYTVGKKGIQDGGGSGGGDDEAGKTGSFTSGSGEEYTIHEGSLDIMADVKLGVDAILGCSTDGNAAITRTEDNNSKEDTAATCTEGVASVILRSSSSILVRATPNQMQVVRHYIAAKNELYTQQVSIQVSFINIEFADENQFNVDFDLVAKSLTNQLEITSSVAEASGILGGLDARGAFHLTSTGGSTQGSKVFLEALSHQGAVTKKTFPRVIAMHNHVGIVGNIDRVNYISKRESFTSASVGSNVSIVQSEAETGFLLYALPNIGATNAIIKLSTSQSALLNIEQKGSGDQLIESPVINDKLFNTTIKVTYGEPLVIAGLSDSLLQTLGSKAGIASTGLSRSSKENTAETILMIEVVRL